jgi:predicted dehydrogenase
LEVEQLYTVYDQMLDEAKPDAVVVATPMHVHAGQSIAALQRDIHVLSEVTAAVSLDEARWLVEACRRSKGVYMMAENYIYRKEVVLVQRMVEAGLPRSLKQLNDKILRAIKAIYFIKINLVWVMAFIIR